MAYYVEKLDLIFLHVPKTGGIWLLNTLSAMKLDPRHVPSRPGVHNRHAKKDDLLKSASHYAAFIRHPVAWYVSYWKYAMSSKFIEDIGEGTDVHPLKELIPLTCDDFSKTVKAIVSERPGFLASMYEAYIHDVEFIGCTESCEMDLKSLMQTLGHARREAIGRMPRANVSRHDDPEVEPELSKLICNVESHALELWHSGIAKNKVAA